MGKNEEKSVIQRASGLRTAEYVCYALGMRVDAWCLDW